MAKMTLAAFLLPTGHHVAAWRHPQSDANAGSSLAHHIRLAQTAERGLLDAVFIADFTGGLDEEGVEAFSRTAYGASFEPLTLLSALASVTERIGLIGTASTTYASPFHLARQFLSLDQLSGGRAGWNLVTTANVRESAHYGQTEHLAHDRRYERAREFAAVVNGLWDSWEDDAFPRDQAAGRFFDPAKLRRLDHQGTHFRTRGPLDLPRSPQGRPVMVQAGSSGPGRDLAAETAELVFTAQQELVEARAFRDDLHVRLAGYGRAPDSLRVMPGVFPIIGRTAGEADDLHGALSELTPSEAGLLLLSRMSGIDLSGLPLDGPLPEPTAVTNGNQSRQSLLVQLARQRNLTIRQLYLEVSGARGHWTIRGTPERIADQLEEWFAGGGADGFNIMPPILPRSLEDFVDLVVPELQRRGLFRTAYEGVTLRENLGLRRPAAGVAA